MIDKMQFLVVYYSGTGGTALAAQHMCDALLRAGLAGEIRDITENPAAAEKAERGDLLVLMFPVHAFNAPKVVYDWIESIPKAAMKKAAVVSVSGGGLMSPNTGCNVSAIKKLKRKGYDVVFDDMLVMPSNFVVATNDLISARLIEVLPEKTDRIARAILSGEKHSINPPLIDRIFSRLGEIEKSFAVHYGKWLRISDACNGCGWCAAHCPAGNISLAEMKTRQCESLPRVDESLSGADDSGADDEISKPVFFKKCHLCLRCIYGCPQKALAPGRFQFIVIKDGFDIGMLKAMVPLNEPVDVDELAKGWYWAGIRKYLQE